MAYLPFLVMLVALLLGVPVAFSLATAGIVGLYLLGGDVNVVLRILATTPFGTVAEYVLTTIPMFILMAYVSAAGGDVGHEDEHGDRRQHVLRNRAEGCRGQNPEDHVHVASEEVKADDARGRQREGDRNAQEEGDQHDEKWQIGHPASRP